MSYTRADSFTSLKRKQEYFSDFPNDFSMSPVGNQLARLTNEMAVNQSIKNLIKTNIGERLFQPNIGGNVYAALFENINKPIMNALEMYITNTIKNNEPRVNLISVNVDTAIKQSTDTKIVYDENSLNIKITYNLINNPEPITFNFILKRIR